MKEAHAQQVADKLIQIAIDGPAGAGKTSVAKILSKRLEITNLDTGAMYRSLAYRMIKKRMTIEDSEEMEKELAAFSIVYRDGRVFTDNEDVTEKIRTEEVTKLASPVSAIGKVRERMVKLQQVMAEAQSVVMEGRDIGTVVLPDAQCKIYLDAELDARVDRRLKEMPFCKNREELKNDMSQRDERDKSRQVAPLKIADDALYIDTTHMTLEEVVNRIIRRVKGEE